MTQIEKEKLLNLLINPLDEDSQVDAVRQLNKYTKDRGVLNLLCTAAVEEISGKLRDALIQSLKLNEEEANRWRFDGVEVYNHVCHFLNGKSSGDVTSIYQLGFNVVENQKSFKHD